MANLSNKKSTNRDARTYVESLDTVNKPGVLESEGDKPQTKPDKSDVIKEQFKFLDDNPVSEDAFGCHKNIADSISRKIELDDKGKTIGLEGTWGSGKSSVIKMLEKRWEENEKIEVFTYDAWIHQGDSLRRAFLEEMITNLKNCEWLPSCRKNEREFKDCLECQRFRRDKCPDYICDNLKLRYEHNTVETQPVISMTGIIFGICTLLMPIFLVLIPTVIGWWKLLYAIIALLPAFIVLIYLAILSYKGEKITALLGELFGKSKDIINHTTQRSPDPTTIEFQEYYRKLLEVALADNDRKLIIVVDNLDRVEANTALGIWGTMRTFLDGSNSMSSSFDDRVWIIVPYDPIAIKQLWNKNRIEIKDDYQALLTVPKSSEKKQEYDLALAFKEKTFQIRYKVSQPLTSKWEAYLDKKLKEAISGQPEEVLQNIFQIFRTVALPKYGIPTPRAMKMFINRIVAMAHHYPCNATLEEIALYVSYEIAEPEIFDQLADTEIKNEARIKDLTTSEFKRALAAIYYGVSKDDADEVLYITGIRNAIAEGDNEGLEVLRTNISAQRVCYNYLNEEVYTWITLDNVLTASSAFDEFLPDEASSLIKKCVISIAKRVASLKGEFFKFNRDLNEDNVDDLIRLIDFCPEIIPDVKRKLSILMSDEDLKKISDLDADMQEWVRVVLKTMMSIKGHGNDPTIHLALKSFSHYNLLLGFVAEEEPSFVRYFCIREYARDRYLKGYLKEIEIGNIEKKDKDIVAGLLEMNNLEEEHHELIAEALVNEFAERPANVLCLVYEILFNHKDSPIFEKTMVSLVETGKAFEALEQLDETLFVAYNLTNILICDSDPQFESGHAAANGIVTFQNLMDDMSEEIANATALKITELNLFEKICNSVSDEIKECDGFGQILRELVDDESMISYLTPERFIEMHDSLKLHLDEEIGEDGVTYYEELVKYLVSDHFVQLLAEEPISRNYAQAYYITISQEEVNSELLDNTLCKKLNDTVGEDEWYEELCKEPEYGILCVVVELVGKGCKLKLTRHFVDALIRHAKDLIEGNVMIGALKDSWDCLLDALERNERIRFREKLLETINDANKPLLQILSIYENEIKQAFDTVNKGLKDAFLHNVCVRIAESRDKCELTWMLGLLDEKKLLVRAKKTEKSLLQERLKDYLVGMYNKETPEGESDSEQISKEVIGRIAKQLGIEPVQKTIENNDEPEDIEPGTDS